MTETSGYPHTLRPELHRALDAAGINYWVTQGLTFWNCPDGRECVAYGYQANGKPELTVKIVGITDPEQAVEATLGRGTCKVMRVNGFMEYIECSECGYRLFDSGWIDISEWNYCPNCGARIEADA